VGFVFGLVRTGLALIPAVLLRVPAKKIAAAVALVAAAAYLALAGPDVATERAFIMAAVMLVAVLIGRRAISLRSLAAAALIVLVLEPESLVDPGFQMSFAATLALILAHRPWTAVQDRVHPLLRPAVLLVIASLAAGAATGPIAAIHFNRIAGYGLLANLLANPVMGLLVMPSGVIAALVAPLGLEALPLWLMGQGCRAILAIAYWVAGLGGAVTAVPTPPGAVLPLMAAGACLAVLARRTPRLAGAAAVAAAFALWAAADRPAVLVAQDGGIVGIMTAEGRALSRESGAGFVAATWLEDDGDLADQAAAYARPGFRHAGTLSAAESPLRIRHLRGKGAGERAAPLCRDGAILVLAEPWEVPPGADCTAYDTRSLRESGSLAISADGQVTTAQEVAGDRLWSRPGTARPDRFQ
jgi:competence protein ComEC